MIHVVGEILVDIFDEGTSKEVFPGGAPFNVASNITHFGGEVSFYGSVGHDDYGRFLTNYARKTSISPLILKKSSSRYTTQAVVRLSNGERSFRFIRENGADYSLRINNLENLGIKKGDIFHIGSLMLSEPRGRSFFYKAVKYAKEKGALISFDINYRDDIFANEQTAKRIFKRAIKVADILKISSEELEVLSNKKRFKSCIKSIVHEGQTAFISLGSEGSCLYHQNVFYFESTRKITPIDTTGAGDAFYSFVLYQLSTNKDILSCDKNIHHMLKLANAVGAIATTKKGAINVVPSLEELSSYIGENNL